MINEFLAFLFFFVPIVLFGLSLIVSYAIGIAKEEPEIIEHSLFFLISFSLSVFASEFFYGKESMLNMARSLSFSNVRDVVCFAMVLFAFINVVLDVVKTSFVRKCN